MSVTCKTFFQWLFYQGCTCLVPHQTLIWTKPSSSFPTGLARPICSCRHSWWHTGWARWYLQNQRMLNAMFYWPGMDADIAHHLKTCHRCQLCHWYDQPAPAQLSALPQHTYPGQQVHANLFSPLRASDKGEKLILCMTDAIIKYVRLVALRIKRTPLLLRPSSTNGSVVLGPLFGHVEFEDLITFPSKQQSSWGG